MGYLMYDELKRQNSTSLRNKSLLFAIYLWLEDQDLSWAGEMSDGVPCTNFILVY